MIDHIEKSQIVILTKYKGMDAQQATTLRRKLREHDVQFKVYKNTIAKRALDELGYGAATGFMDGPTAWAFANDPIIPPKVLKEFSKEVPAVEMSGAILDGKVISKGDLDVLAGLPPRETLLAHVVGTVAGPLRMLVGVLYAVPRKLVTVLDQVRQQEEERGATAQ